ncbi:MAG: tRNA (adenosine(37)-N6)-threonylcarbamoyltransferase complex dimerization subunit type 1 TsaB [Arachnia propionica]|nr:MAG: tRNA (adenosine(37)-N6)-threonylcarbamoyltransferase complex dimerization subunit type 1 TsaB [Arachnia propionica]
MTWSLGIDTSYFVATGLARDGEAVDELVVPDTRAHGEALMPAVMRLCERNHISVSQLDEIVVGMGPGPFTGLRVGIVAAEVLAAAGELSLHRVCSLDVVARQWQDAPAEFLVCSDARRREVYWARYQGGSRIGQPQVSPAAQLPELPIAGLLPDHVQDRSVAPGAPTQLSAATLAARWRELPEADAEPFYLRPADATVGGPPKSALPKPRLRR